MQRVSFKAEAGTRWIEPGLAGLTEEHLEAAYSEAAKLGVSLRESILSLGLVSEIELLSAIAEKTGCELVDLSTTSIETDALGAISANLASHYHIVPVRLAGDTLQVATSDPFNPDLVSEIGLVLDAPYQIEFVLAPSEAIRKAIRKCYGVGADTVQQMVTDKGIEESATAKDDLTDENRAQEASIIKLVNQILTDAIAAGATDIHFEPYENDLRVRYRIDGILNDSGMPATVRHFRDGITSRIKIISGLDIAEKRLPQDGRAQVHVSHERFDLRISTLPTRYGEAVDIRILPRGTLISDLPSLGLPLKDANELKKLLALPHGIILVTGPTGSGKTTTLYTCMNLLNHTDRKIITIEDPIEYDMAGLVQMQVQPEINFTFARALRSILRHDPDIILVGEIRDQETADTAIRTALTGHLVFSTLHTNSAASAMTRLLDMGIEPYLVASSVEAILAQRLVRVICQNCKEECKLNTDTLCATGSSTKQDELSVVYHGRGCSMCRFTGFRGRTAITELLVMTDRLRRLVMDKSHADEIAAQASREGTVSLFQAGMEKVRQGVTTYDEILRVTKGAVIVD